MRKRQNKNQSRNNNKEYAGNLYSSEISDVLFCYIEQQGFPMYIMIGPLYYILLFYLPSGKIKKQEVIICH